MRSVVVVLGSGGSLSPRPLPQPHYLLPQPYRLRSEFVISAEMIPDTLSTSKDGLNNLS